MQWKRIEQPVAPVTFLHSGQIGDLIYSLPTIRALGGGVLFLAPGNRADAHFTREMAEQSGTLLRRQPYLADVRIWAGEPITHNLDRFREGDTQRGNLADLHLAAFGLPVSERDRPWIENVVPLKVPGKTAVFQRTPRQRNPEFSWRHIHQEFGDRAVLVGNRDEHRLFEQEVGLIDCFVARDLLEMASLIRGADIFVGNQSCGYALAAAMHHPNCILEVSPSQPVNLFDRNGARNFWRYP